MVMGKKRVATKIRSAKSPPDVDDVSSARDRFKGALQELLPQLSDEESESGEDEAYATKPKRMSSTQPKKKTEKNSENDSNKSSQQPYVMKLFDRSVDLAQFNEKTPLYLICRAWISNQPHQVYNPPATDRKWPPPPDVKEEIVKEENGLDNVKDTYSLPPPEEKPAGATNLRIPEVIKNESQYKLTEEEEGVELPSKEDLLRDNLAHWNRVRKSWLDAATKNEERYRKSLKTLVAIYNKAQKQYEMQQ